jgi:hypothetical protein
MPKKCEQCDKKLPFSTTRRFCATCRDDRNRKNLKIAPTKQNTPITKELLRDLVTIGEARGMNLSEVSEAIGLDSSWLSKKLYAMTNRNGATVRIKTLEKIKAWMEGKSKQKFDLKAWSKKWPSAEAAIRAAKEISMRLANERQEQQDAIYENKRRIIGASKGDV